MVSFFSFCHDMVKKYQNQDLGLHIVVAINRFRLR